MNGKELVLSAISRKKVERIPWVPFCGVHSGSLIGKTASEYLKSSQNIIDGLNKAIELYKPDGFPVIFDLQIEAEIFGCELNWTNDNPPAVISHPLSMLGGKQLEDLPIITENDGRIPVVVEALQTLRKQHEDKAIYGLITGPFTLALHLLGTDIFMEMFDNPQRIHEIMDFCNETAKKMSSIYLKNGCDIIAVVDPMTSQIGADHFKEFCSAPSTELFEHIRKEGGKASFFVCGHAQNNIEVMCDTKPDNISIDENIPLDFVKEICVKKDVSFGGNMKLTTVMLLGTPNDNQIDAIACMETGGDTGFILAPGCDMPYATPVENAQAIAEVVLDPYKREVAKEIANNADSTACELFDMSEYGSADKVKIDIITLDSEGCAPCQYMVEAVKSAIPEFGELVEWEEHKIKDPEAIKMMGSLYVRNIPTICIDGQIKFVSIIPPKEELINAIHDRIRDKFALKIKYNKGRILLLGNNSNKKYKILKENIHNAMKELGPKVDFIEINDKKEIRQYGVFNTPAVITEKYKLKSSGHSVEKNIIKEWIKVLNE
ncbi:MAG: thioredoxin family protein [Victivallales bacterium]|nr:thioredoxin family protein [Victivallales bacterium]